MFARRLVVGTLESMCRAMWGFPPRMIRPMVASMGTAGGLRWFTVNMPRCFIAQRTLGPVRAHLAIVLISLNNGCTYCAFGHAYALELLYLRDHDRLFPVDARTIAGWTDLEPRRLTERLRAALEQAGLHSEAVWADQVLALATGDQHPVDADEVRVANLVRIVGEMNEVAIAHAVQPDQAHDAINKDAALKRRHEALRTALA
jgi:alkylhydroperoxidase family enzyme